VVTASSEVDTLEIRHDAHSRRGFAQGAVRAAEWVVGKSGAWDFREIAISCESWIFQLQRNRNPRVKSMRRGFS